MCGKSRDYAHATSSDGIDHSDRSAGCGSPRAQRPPLSAAILRLQQEWVAQDDLLGFFRADPVPCDVFPVFVIPLELHRGSYTYRV